MVKIAREERWSEDDLIRRIKSSDEFFTLKGKELPLRNQLKFENHLVKYFNENQNTLVLRLENINFNKNAVFKLHVFLTSSEYPILRKMEIKGPLSLDLKKQIKY